MASVFRVNGSKYWQIAFIDGTGKRRTKSSKCTDKGTAERIANKLESESALRREGVIDPLTDSFARHGRRPISEHLDEYGSSQRNKSGALHVDETRNKIDLICNAIGAKLLADMKAEKVQEFLRSKVKEGRSPRTIGAYIQAIRGFSRWCMKTEKLPRDPLVSLTKPDPESDRRLTRRFLKHEEFQWLNQTTRLAPTSYGMTGLERTLLYELAIHTGFRAGELRQLTMGKLNLDLAAPFVLAKGATTKNKKQARQYIPVKLALELKDHTKGRLAGSVLFSMPPRWDVAHMFRSDLVIARDAWLTSLPETERSGAEKSDFLKDLDSEGERLDFHSLRHTTASWLIQSGADIKVVQTIMRHSDIKLTLDRYGHLYPGSESDAMARMVADINTKTSAHIQRASAKQERELADCVGEALSVARQVESELNQENIGNSQVYQEKTRVRAVGLEPTTNGLKVRCSTD